MTYPVITSEQRVVICPRGDDTASGILSRVNEWFSNFATSVGPSALQVIPGNHLAEKHHPSKCALAGPFKLIS